MGWVRHILSVQTHFTWYSGLAPKHTSKKNIYTTMLNRSNIWLQHNYNSLPLTIQRKFINIEINDGLTLRADFVEINAQNDVKQATVMF